VTDYASPVGGREPIEAEPAEHAARNLVVGAHLWASATVFFFADFLFAYFYLRSIDAGGMWRPKHVDPSLALGTASTACLVALAAATSLALRGERAGRPERWLATGILGLALGLAAVGLQLAEWATQGFGPTDGAYASVYVGWTGLLVVFLLGTLYWLETVLATALRHRARPAAVAGGDPAGGPGRARYGAADPLFLLHPQLQAVAFYTRFLAGVGVISWIVLYLV